MKKVFISHSSLDKPFVRKLKRDLLLNDIKTWVDQDEMFPGDSLIDKLEIGLEESTHFVIVLSPNSIDSEWVNFELENALNQVEETTIEKIIPILYRNCKIPKSLDKLIYVNLSKETVFIKNSWLEFHGEKYEEELHKLKRSILRSTPSLTKAEKEDLSNLKPITGGDSNGYPTIYLKVVGYKSISKFLSIYIPEEERQKVSRQKTESLLPIVLPIFLKKYFVNLEYGDPLTICNEKGVSITGNFAKFSKNNNRIALPRPIREDLEIRNLSTYKVEINYLDLELVLIKVNDE